MNDFVIFPNKNKYVMLACFALVFLAAGVFIIFDPKASSTMKLNGGYLGVPFFGLFLGHCIYRILKPVPSIMVNGEGIFENASSVGAGLLRWSEIAEVKMFTFNNKRFLGILPKDMEQAQRRLLIHKRLLMQLNLWLVEVPIIITPKALPIPLERVLDEINARRPPGN